MKSMLLAAVVVAAGAREATAQVRIQTAPGAYAYVTGDPDRPMIGVSTRTSGKRDTLGLLIESVTRGSPAEKAGIEEGDRFVSVNGVNLKLSPLDAGEEDMEGVANRRLIRELTKLKAGDEVDLRVYRDGTLRNVKVKTVAAEELNKETLGFSTATWSKSGGDRAVLGLSLGGNGSRRDTLGVLVVGVSDSGPAAKAGIDEGDRLVSINTVDLRVSGEDAGDSQASNARIRRLNREMEKVKAGDAVELRFYSNGQTKTVRVEAAKASDIGGEGFFFDGGGGALFDKFRMAIPKSGRIMFRPRLDGELDKLSVPSPKLTIERQLRGAETAKLLKAAPTVRIKRQLEPSTEALKKKLVRRTIIL
jgi:S1-C subfamily serine protease